MSTQPSKDPMSMQTETDIDLANRLMRFYDVDTLYALIRAQNHHVEKLQTKNAAVEQRRYDEAFNRAREG